MAICEKCEQENSPESRFCSGCGSAIAAPVSSLLGAVQVSRPHEGKPEAYPAAPRGRRVIAAVIDLIIGSVFLVLVVAVPMWLRFFMGGGLPMKVGRFLPAMYLLLRDSLFGRSIGKALMGLVTYDRNLNRPGNVVDSVVRNWPLAMAVIPWVGWVISGILGGIIAIQILLGRSQRLGDGFAATQVIDEKWLVAG